MKRQGLALKLMEQKVKKRIKAWKRFYAKKAGILDENASWRDILQKLKLSLEDSDKMAYRAIMRCGPFTNQELLYLRLLPYYQEVKEFLLSMPNDNLEQCFSLALSDDDRVYFVRYPDWVEVQKDHNLNMVPIFEATIVCKEPIEFDADIYVWNTICHVDNWSKHIVIRYAHEKPADFIESDINDDVPF